MSKPTAIRGATVAGMVVLLAWAGVGLANQEPAPKKPGAVEQIGAAIDRSARILTRRAKDLSASVEAALNRTRDQIQNFGVEARVTGRLLWDKDLQNAQIELEINDQGVIVLHGTVPDATAQHKAVTLANDTIGVTRVVDRLKIVPPAKTPAPNPEARP